jgi:ribosomal protein L12E/L44/L45/RPP1/RPP2
VEAWQLTHKQEVLSAVGIEADSDRLDKLISELEGKDINEVRVTTLTSFEP